MTDAVRTYFLRHLGWLRIYASIIGVVAALLLGFALITELPRWLGVTPEHDVLVYIIVALAAGLASLLFRRTRSRFDPPDGGLGFVRRRAPTARYYDPWGASRAYMSYRFDPEDNDDRLVELWSRIGEALERTEETEKRRLELERDPESSTHSRGDLVALSRDIAELIRRHRSRLEPEFYQREELYLSEYHADVQRLLVRMELLEQELRSFEADPDDHSDSRLTSKE